MLATYNTMPLNNFSIINKYFGLFEHRHRSTFCEEVFIISQLFLLLNLSCVTEHLGRYLIPIL